MNWLKSKVLLVTNAMLLVPTELRKPELTEQKFTVLVGPLVAAGVQWPVENALIILQQYHQRRWSDRCYRECIDILELPRCILVNVGDGNDGAGADEFGSDDEALQLLDSSLFDGASKASKFDPTSPKLAAIMAPYEVLSRKRAEFISGHQAAALISTIKAARPKAWAGEALAVADAVKTQLRVVETWRGAAPSMDHEALDGLISCLRVVAATSNPALNFVEINHADVLAISSSASDKKSTALKTIYTALSTCPFLGPQFKDLVKFFKFDIVMKPKLKDAHTFLESCTDAILIGEKLFEVLAMAEQMRPNCCDDIIEANPNCACIMNVVWLLTSGCAGPGNASQMQVIPRGPKLTVGLPARPCLRWSGSAAESLRSRAPDNLGS